MPSYRIAQLQEKGQDIIIVPFGDDFGGKSDDQKNEMIDELQRRASAAALEGQVIAVWPNGSGLSFLAPPPLYPFLRSLSWSNVLARLNKQLTW